MTDIVKGMFYAYDAAADAGAVTGPDKMRAALLFLADNVSDEMERAYLNGCSASMNGDGFDCFKDGIAAAIRAAAGGNSD
jgi:hypothetical protein